jgi:hypothetical protein
VQARGYDDLPVQTLDAFAGAHVADLEPETLRDALAAAVHALVSEGGAANLEHANRVAKRLDL